jgi:peptide/nickel transport system substrate-binding protein
MMSKGVRISLLSILIAGLLAGFAGAADLAKDQALNIAFDAGDLKSLDPHRAAATADRAIVDMMFNGLVRYPPGNQVKLEPDIAESWTVSADKKVWTFKLRKGVFFHPYAGSPNGYELTSEDVVFSLKRAANKDTSAYAGDYNGITVDVVDPMTVKITIDKPISDPLFLAKFANYTGGFIVSKKAIETKGEDWFKTNPVGTGAFRFESYEPRQKVVLAANPKYFRGAPVLKKVTARFMPDVSSREFGLQTGELDIIEGLKEDKWIEKVSTFKDVKAPTFGPCETQVLFFNMSIPPFNDLRVRKAFSYALSRDVIANFMGKSLAVPIYSPALAPPALGALTKDEALKAGVVYDNNVEQAKKLLAEAGFPNGIKTEAIVSEMSSSYQKPMVAIQALVRKAGIDMQVKIVDHASFHSKIRENASPIVYYASWRPNEDVYLTQFYFSESVVQKGKKPITNFSHYGLVDANADGKVDSVDSLIETARWELNPQKQEALWKEAQIQLLKDVVSVPIIRLKYTFPQKSYVDLGYPLEWAWQTYSPQITEKTRILAHK